MSDRKAELERKRKKLEEIRRNREEKKRIEAGKSTKPGDEGPSLYTETDLDRKRREADELLRDIDLGGIKSTVTSQSPPQKGAASNSPQQISSDSPIRSPLRPVQTLSISKLNQTNIPPKEIVAYNKETQTPVIQKSTESDEEQNKDDKNENEKEEIKEAVKDEAEEQKEKILESKPLRLQIPHNKNENEAWFNNFRV